MQSNLEELIEQCNRIALDTNEIHFIIQNNDVYSDGSNNTLIIIDSHIFIKYPSIFVIYDTEFKELNNFSKFQKAYDVLYKYGFENSQPINNAVEQVFNIKLQEDENIFLHIKVVLCPNMTINFEYSICDKENFNDFNKITYMKRYFREQFLKDIFYTTLNSRPSIKEYLRKLKIEQIIY